MKSFSGVLLLMLLVASCGPRNSTGRKTTDDTAAGTQNGSRLSDEEIADAYIYLLGRELVLKQERLDFEKEGFKWNQILHRTPGGVAWPNPNLDVAYSEAWVAVDENNCVVLEIPEIKSRYYTWQMLNGWGETLLNINERTYPEHPFGKYALCLKNSHPKIPAGCLRVDLPAKTSRVLARVALGDDPKEAVRLQHLFTLTPQGDIKVEPPVSVPLFEGRNFPDAAIFQNASEKMQSDPDINEGMDAMQVKVKAVAALIHSDSMAKLHVDSVILQKAVPLLFQTMDNLGVSGNGWSRPKAIGNYGSDYKVRTAVNYGGIWANNMGEVTYFVRNGIDGSATYTLSFPKDALPQSKAGYFWSVIAVDAVKFQVLSNPLKKYLLNKQSKVKTNADGSLTLVFGPKPLDRYPKENWLPTIAGEKYNMTFRFYGPSKDIVDGSYFPPDIVSVK